jgi:arylsulfatase A-like enzyme
MNQAERQSPKANPFTTGLVVGLGWGLGLGLIDGVPILLEVPILLHLQDRLKALFYLVTWYGLTGAVLLGTLGIIAWGAMWLLRQGSGQVLRREVKRRSLVAVYSGVSVGLATLLAGLHGLDVPLERIDDPGYAALVLLLILLGGAIGLIEGLSVYGVISWWQGKRGFLRPLRWGVVRTAVVAVFLVGVVSLLAVLVQQSDWYNLALARLKPFRQAATPEQPNILLITIDALRADHLGTYGYDSTISPNIDGLARQGVVFDQAISQAPWTGPSVASFITSLYPMELGICHRDISTTELHVDKRRVTMAEVLQGAGHRTQAYVTNSLVAPGYWFDQGFDGFSVTHFRRSFDLEALHKRTLVGLVCDGSKKLFDAQAVCGPFDRGYKQLFGPRLTWGLGWPVREYGQRFLRAHQDERFFLWLYYVDPHARYDPPEPFRPLPSEITPARERALRSAVRRQGLTSDLISPADLEALVSLYDGEITYVDALIGQILDELDRLGLADRTVVILNADHGEEFQDHGEFAHGHTLYDELVRVPLIISGPGVSAPGRRVETPVRMLDLLPTVCEIVGAPVPEEAEGRSLVPFLRGEDMEELPAFSEALHQTLAEHEMKAIRHDGYKLIYDTVSGAVELYDLRTDPAEQVNLAGQEPEIAGAMLAELETWLSHSAQVVIELPRQRPLSKRMDEETRQQLRDAGY